jgi:hypothetical protein
MVGIGYPIVIQDEYNRFLAGLALWATLKKPA